MCCAWTSHSSQRTRSCGHDRAAESSPTALWTSTASWLSITFGRKTLGSTCAPAPICSPWTRAPPSSMSQVRDWHRSLTWSSFSELAQASPVSLSSCAWQLHVLVLVSCCFSLIRLNSSVQQPCLFFFPLVLFDQCSSGNYFGFLLWFDLCVCVCVCLFTNQPASVSSYYRCQTFTLENNTACERLRGESIIESVHSNEEGFIVDQIRAQIFVFWFFRQLNQSFLLGSI